MSTDTTGSGTGGMLTWNYSVAAAAVEYLAAGESKVETFSFDISDGHGGSVSRAVSVTLTGTNDVPLIADTTDPGAVAEWAGSSWMDLAPVTGSFAVSDADASDTLSAQVVGAPVVRLEASHSRCLEARPGWWEPACSRWAPSLPAPGGGASATPMTQPSPASTSSAKARR